MKRSLTILSIALFFFSCTTGDKEKRKFIVSSPPTRKIDSIGKIPCFIVGKDSVTLLPFEVSVNLSPKAQERFKDGKETIIISVGGTGDPKDSSNAQISEDGQFYIFDVEKEVHPGEVTRFDHISIPLDVFDELKGRNFEMGIQVWSGRKTSPDNLLLVQPAFGPVTNVVNQKIVLKGGLLKDDDGQ